MGFLWGASLSSHQVEGNLENDWTRREQRYADEWASQSFFDRLRDYIIGADPPEFARNTENYHSGLATDHYNRYKEDIELADSIGLNALRFSIEWSRIEPEQGSIDQNAIDHYRSVVKNLRQRNIEPVLTIWHYAHPQWFVDEYGWHDDEAPEVFSEYVERVVDALGGLVTHWIPMNEPMGYLRGAYNGNGFPPEDGTRRQIPAVYRNLVRGHRLAHDRIKELGNGTEMVGTALASGAFEPYTSNWLNEQAANLLSHVERERFLEAILSDLDWIGVNYYYHYKVDIFLRNLFNRDSPRSDMGWPLSPKGLYELVRRTSKYGKPIVVTEHGLADSDDEHRGWYIEESIKQLERVRDEGVTVNGYFHWSLTDNFEWTDGFWPRFGLVEVNYKEGQQRELRESADTYGEVIEARNWGADWPLD